MRPDKNYHTKIETLRDFFRGGWVYQSLDQMRSMLGYANRAGVRGFFVKLVASGMMTMKDRGYIPTDDLIGYALFESVRAGLPFTPENHATSQMNLDTYLIDHPASTYFVRVKGDSMEDAGIIEWDIVVLDRSIVPKNGDIVIASLEGDVTLKYFEKDGDMLKLVPANPRYKPIIVDGPCEILWVVTGSVRKYQ
jgi:DNA polymerase V